MKNFWLGFIIFYVFFPLLLSCEEGNEKNDNDDNNKYEVKVPENPVYKENRVYGVNISESKNGFESSFMKAQEAGVEIIELNIAWNAIEMSRGKYTDPWGLFAATGFYGANNIMVNLSIAVINTVKWEVPDYLDPAHCNNEEFITAFNDMIDWVLKEIPSSVIVHGLSIGNEIDLVLESDEDWVKYTKFYEEVRIFLDQEYPDIKVGVKTTVMGGIYGNELQKIQSINQYSDVIMLNYYPQGPKFRVLKPDICKEHFPEIISYFPGKKIWFTELGYQSGSDYCESSEEKQALFFHYMFHSWDENRENIELILIDWLHDQSPEIIEEWKGYYGNDKALVEYLSTLGLRNYDGTDKFAWKQLIEEVKARDWID